MTEDDDFLNPPPKAVRRIFLMPEEKVRDLVALILFAKWSLDGVGWPEREWQEPDWADYSAGRHLNVVGLDKKHFEDEAEWLMNLARPHLALSPAGEG